MLLSISEKHRICSNCTKSLLIDNPMLSAKKWGFDDGTTICYLASSFFVQWYKPQ